MDESAAGSRAAPSSDPMNLSQAALRNPRAPLLDGQTQKAGQGTTSEANSSKLGEENGSPSVQYHAAVFKVSVRHCTALNGHFSQRKQSSEKRRFLHIDANSFLKLMKLRVPCSRNGKKWLGKREASVVREEPSKFSLVDESALHEEEETRVTMRGKASFQIAESEFELYQQEFRVWLLDRHDVSLDKLDERKARKHFRKFVDKWNSDRVEESIYKLADERRKRAASNATGRTTSVDEKQKKQGDLGNEITEVFQAGSSRPERWEIKEWRKRQTEVLDELVPKPDPGSQAARMDKKRRKRAGGGDSPPEVTDSTLYGTNHSDLKEVIAKRKASRDRRNKARKAAADERIEALAEKERQRMQAFKDRLGLGDRFQTSASKPP